MSVLKIEIIDFGAVNKNRLPKRAHETDVGADVFAPYDWHLAPGQTIKMPLGFGVKLPNGCAGFVFPKSGLSEKGIICQLPPIDPYYTQQVHAIIYNSGDKSYYIKENDKIGQLVILPCVIADFVTASLKKRGANGFGSTGK